MEPSCLLKISEIDQILPLLLMSSVIITIGPSIGKQGSCFSRFRGDLLQERETGQKKKKKDKIRKSCWMRENSSQPEHLEYSWHSSWVYFCHPKRLHGALSEIRLLCCLTRKEEKEQGAKRKRRGCWPGSFSPTGCAFPRGWRIFISWGVMKL